VNGDTTGVITTVFKALQALDQNGKNIALGNCTNNAAHKNSSWVKASRD
jgi:hypothetical protein